MPAFHDLTVTCSCGEEYVERLMALPGRTPTPPKTLRCPTCVARDRADAEATQLQRDRILEEERFRQRCQERYAALAVPKVFAGVTRHTLRPWGSKTQQGKIARAGSVGLRIVGDITGGIAPLPLVAFLGGPGTGKTMLAWGIAIDLTRDFGHTAKVVRLSALVRDLRGAWGSREGPSEEERLRKYLTPDYLAIDEVSRHAFYGAQIHQHLYDVINSRLEDEKITVLTSNESEAGLAEILGPALMSRLMLGGIVDFGTEDYRNAQARAEATR